MAKTQTSWPKGQSGNPTGRPQGAVNKELTELKGAVNNVGKSKRKSIFRHFVERAYDSDNVLIALMKKIVADVKFEERNLNIGGQKGNPIKVIVFSDDSDTKRKVRKRPASRAGKRAKRV